MVSYAETVRELAQEAIDAPEPLDVRDRPHFQRVADREAALEDWQRVLRSMHGDIEDAKTAFIIIADEEGFALDAEDIPPVTDEPPGTTFQ